VSSRLRITSVVLIFVLSLSLALAPASSAQNVVLSFLTGGTPDLALNANTETLVWNFDVYPPASAQFQNSQNILSGPPSACVEPIDVSRCPDYWAVLLLLTPITVRNDSTKTGLVTMTVYSDNAYVYQQLVTITPRAYMPISLGAISLGYVMNSMPDIPMPVRVTITATQSMTVLRDTAQPTALLPGAARAWGAMVELRPM
jgi:hypothetical protein